MKKLLLSMAALLSLGFVANADITEEFVQGSGFPTATVTASTTPTSVTSANTGIEYSVLGCRLYTTSPNYLMIATKTQKNPKAYIEFELPIDCAEIVMTTGSGNSTNANNKVNVYADEELIATYACGVKSSEVKVTIPAANRSAGTVYKIEGNSTSYNTQFTSFKYVEVTAEPKLSTDVDSQEFAIPLNGSQSKPVTIIAENITDEITVTSDNDKFATSVTDGTLEITYSSNEAGTDEATITISAGALSTTVSVSAITVAQEATETDPLTAESVIAMNNLNAGPFCVTGVIAEECAANASDGVLQTTTTITNTNIVLKGESAIIAVALPVGDARTLLNIKDTPANAGKTVIVKGSLEAYFGAPGVKNASYVSGLSGVEDITVNDVNAPVEYFNLQGVRVAEPSNGLFIRRQGNTVEKVIIR